MNSIFRIDALRFWVFAWSITLVLLLNSLIESALEVFPQTWACALFQSGLVAFGVWVYRSSQVHALQLEEGERDFTNTHVAPWFMGIFIPFFLLLLVVLLLAANIYTFAELEPFMAVGGALGWVQMLLNAQEQILFAERKKVHASHKRRHRNSWRK